MYRDPPDVRNVPTGTPITKYDEDIESLTSRLAVLAMVSIPAAAWKVND